jgi:hypothetical protein
MVCADADSLIILPGLGGGHAYGSFKEEGSDYMWLIDRLPFDYDIFRIITYGFDTTLPNSDNTQDLEAVATEFRASLRSIRTRSMVSCSNSFSFLQVANMKSTIRLQLCF